MQTSIWEHKGKRSHMTQSACGEKESRGRDEEDTVVQTCSLQRKNVALLG